VGLKALPGDEVSDKSDNLETQLDALAEQCADDADAAPRPSEGGDAVSPPADDDLAGTQFADQVQQMLDEATANLEEAGTMKTVEQTTGETSAPVAPAADAEPDQEADDSDQLISQIDAMLADAADDVAGNFESIDDIETASEEALPADPASFQSVDEVEADPADADSDDVALAGEFQSVDDLEDAAARPVASGSLEAEQDADEQLSEGAAAVAAELDAEESIAGDFESPDEALEDDEPAIESAGRQVQSQPAADPPAAESDADDAPVESSEDASPSPLVAVLAKINKPLDRCSEPMKNAVGTVAFATLGLAFACFCMALMGRLIGGLIGAPIAGLVTVAAFYVLFLRTPGNGNDEPGSV